MDTLKSLFYVVMNLWQIWNWAVFQAKYDAGYKTGAETIPIQRAVWEIICAIDRINILKVKYGAESK